MSDPTIDIRWRWDEMTKEIIDATSRQQHEQIKRMIALANKTGNFAEIIDAIETTIDSMNSIITRPDFLGDPAVVLAHMKRFIKTIYAHCPGLESAINKDGMIDPIYLPD